MILLYQSFRLDVVSSYFDLYIDGQFFRASSVKTEDEVTDIYELTNYILM